MKGLFTKSNSTKLRMRTLFSFGTKNTKGFTLIELIVVLALVIISSSVVIFNYNGSRQAVVLSATALDIANMLHIAQIGGRSASGNQTDYNNTIQELSFGGEAVRTGISFTVSNQNVIHMLVYRGVDGNMGYHSLAGDTTLEIRNISAAGLILRLCTNGVPSTPGPCSAYGSSTSIEFTRLSTDPVVEVGYETALGSNPVVIQVESTSGSTTIYRYVVIEGTGNIFVR